MKKSKFINLIESRIAKVLESDEWWSKMSPKDQAEYIKKHPHSKKAKEAKKKIGKKLGKVQQQYKNQLEKYPEHRRLNVAAGMIQAKHPKFSEKEVQARAKELMKKLSVKFSKSKKPAKKKSMSVDQELAAGKQKEIDNVLKKVKKFKDFATKVAGKGPGSPAYDREIKNYKKVLKKLGYKGNIEKDIKAKLKI